MSEPVEILLVDDNPVVRLGLSHVLRTAGYRVAEATNGAECLRQMAERLPDLVLLDVVLPDIDGVELVRRIKASPELGAAFVVLLSSVQTASEQQATGLDAGADGYLARPIANRELVARMHSLVRIQQAELALRRAKAELEQRVVERTEELSRANVALRAEVKVREAGEAKERRYVERLKIFRAIDQAILQVQAPRQIAEVALRQIQALLPFEQAIVVELTAGGERAVALATINQGAVQGDSWALTEEQLRLSRTLQAGQTRRVRRSRNLFQVPDAAHHLFGKTWETLVDLPLLAKDKLIGALNLASDAVDAFNEEHLEIAHEIVHQPAHRGNASGELDAQVEPPVADGFGAFHHSAGNYFRVTHGTAAALAAVRSREYTSAYGWYSRTGFPNLAALVFGGCRAGKRSLQSGVVHVL